MRLTVPTPGRRGGVLPVVALLFSVVLVMAAFALDVGYITSVQSQLQNAADAAALAGAGELMPAYVQYYYPLQPQSARDRILRGAVANARAKAKEFAALNAAGGV